MRVRLGTLKIGEKFTKPFDISIPKHNFQVVKMDEYVEILIGLAITMKKLIKKKEKFELDKNVFVLDLSSNKVSFTGKEDWVETNPVPAAKKLVNLGEVPLNSKISCDYHSNRNMTGTVVKHFVGDSKLFSSVINEEGTSISLFPSNWMVEILAEAQPHV